MNTKSKNNTFTITYTLVKRNKHNSDSEDEPTILTKTLRKKLEAFVKDRDIDFWSDFLIDLDPKRNLICEALRSPTCYFTDNSYVLTTIIPKVITQNDLDREDEGIFAGWHDSDPMELEVGSDIYNVHTGVKLHCKN